MKFLLLLTTLALLVNESLAQTKTVNVNSSNVMVFPQPGTFRVNNPSAIGIKYWDTLAAMHAGLPDFDGQIQITSFGTLSLYGTVAQGNHPAIIIDNDSIQVKSLFAPIGIVFGNIGSNSYPSLQRNGSGLDVLLGDSSGLTTVRSLYERFGSGSPEGVQAAPVGAIYHNTTGGANTTLWRKRVELVTQDGWQ